MRSRLAILVTLVACTDHGAASLTKIKNQVCACKTASCAEQALKLVPQGTIESTHRTQTIARDMLDCLAKRQAAERPITDPDAEPGDTEPGPTAAAPAPAAPSPAAPTAKAAAPVTVPHETTAPPAAAKRPASPPATSPAPVARKPGTAPPAAARRPAAAPLPPIPAEPLDQ